jgi:hypothetical protein
VDDRVAGTAGEIRPETRWAYELTAAESDEFTVAIAIRTFVDF